MERKSNTDMQSEVVKATREAELGVATCRSCGHVGEFSKFITIMFGGSLVYALCLKCVVIDGNEILIRRGAEGIEVLNRKSEILSIGNNSLGVLGGSPK